MSWAPDPKPEWAPQPSAPKHASQLPPRRPNTAENEILRLRTRRPYREHRPGARTEDHRPPTSRTSSRETPTSNATRTQPHTVTAETRRTLTVLAAAAYWDRTYCGIADPSWTLIGMYTRGGCSHHLDPRSGEPRFAVPASRHARAMPSRRRPYKSRRRSRRHRADHPVIQPATNHSRHQQTESRHHLQTQRRQHRCRAIAPRARR